MKYFENTVSHRKPPGTRLRPAPWRIAVLANLKDEFEYELDDPPDAGAEFDRRETVEAIAQALELDGHWVHICAGDQSLVESLTNLRPHICFNITEGVQGDAREAQAPALCELLGIPYTASRVLTNALSLDKTQTKCIWQSNGLPTPAFQEFRTGREPLHKDLRFPLIAKPAREGTGMGIDGSAILHDERALRKRVNWLIKTYRQPALVEAFLHGREFTVGYIGNPGSPRNRRRPWVYNTQGYHVFPILELDSSKSVSPGVYGNAAKSYDIGEQGAPEYLCPAAIPRKLERKMVDLSLRAAEAVGALDVSRIDLRLGADGEPYLLEINTLPGLNPSVSDLCIMAASEGMSYDVLISEILYLGAERFGLSFEQIARQDAFRFPSVFRERANTTARSVVEPIMRAALRRNL